MEHGILQADVVHHDDENRHAANCIELRNSSLHAISYPNGFRAVTARQILNDAGLPAAGRSRPYNTVCSEHRLRRRLHITGTYFHVGYNVRNLRHDGSATSPPSDLDCRGTRNADETILGLLVLWLGARDIDARIASIGGVIIHR
jgi:hypothetical protein